MFEKIFAWFSIKKSRKKCHLSATAQFHVLYVISLFFPGLNFIHPIANILVIYVLLRVAGGSKFSVVFSFIFNSVSMTIYLLIIVLINIKVIQLSCLSNTLSQIHTINITFIFTL